MSNSGLFGRIINATTENRQTTRNLVPRVVATHPSVLRRDAQRAIPDMRDAMTSTEDLEEYVNQNTKSKEQKVLNKWLAKEKTRAEQRALMAVVMQTEQGTKQDSDDEDE